MKSLHYFNLFGVLVLALLCLVQWNTNRQLNLEVNSLSKAQFDLAAKLAEEEQTARGLTADLAQFKEQFTRAEKDLGDTQRKLSLADHETHQLIVEREHLKTSITNWAAAVTTRDERLSEANTQLRRLSDDLNFSVRKFNDLATNHNALVKDVNELRARLAQPRSKGATEPAPAKNGSP